MSIKVAINGFGRIGRCTLRAIYEQGLQNEFEVVAINASGDLTTNAHLLKYDTTHGRFATSVETEGENCIIIDGKKIPFYCTKDPLGVNWGSHGVDVLLECTGAYTTKTKAQVLLDQGAKRVLISAPGGDDVDTTIVMGVGGQIAGGVDGDHFEFVLQALLVDGAQRAATDTTETVDGDLDAHRCFSLK